jgi:hypothetical protein
VTLQHLVSTFWGDVAEVGSHCVPQAGLVFEIFLAQPLQYCDYRCAPACQLILLDQ